MTEIVDNYTMFAVCEDVSECICSISILLIPTCFCLIVFLLLLYIYFVVVILYILYILLVSGLHIYFSWCVCVVRWGGGGWSLLCTCCLPVISLIN